MTNTLLTPQRQPLSTHWGEREGPDAKRREGEVGVLWRFPRLTPILSAPKGGEGVRR
jgi:hypothetical protein